MGKTINTGTISTTIVYIKWMVFLISTENVRELSSMMRRKLTCSANRVFKTKTLFDDP